jgi:glycosyltransferase involved in cell wall biosynthesis
MSSQLMPLNSSPSFRELTSCMEFQPRLLLVSTAPVFIRSFLLPYTRHFRALGWEVDGMANGITSDKEVRDAFDRVWDIDWSRKPLDSANFVRAPAVICQAMNSRRYDIVHVHTPVAGLVCRYALRREKAAIRIYTAHGFHFHEHGARWKNQLYLRLEQLAGRWTDCLVLINKEDETAARRNRIVSDDRIVYMPGIGIRRSDYRPGPGVERAAAELRAQLKVAPASPIVLMIAEFVPRKRHADAIRAFSQIRNKEAYLVLAGDGDLKQEIEQLALEHNIKSRVRFVGFRRDIPTILSAAAVKILPSEQEGLPKSIMEAICMGVPVIATDIRGTRDLLADGAGILVPPRNVECLAESIDWVLTHPAEATEMAKAAALRMERYDCEHIAHLHQTLYLKLLRQKGRTNVSDEKAPAAARFIEN